LFYQVLDPSWFYLASRFVRRNRALAASLAALALAIAGGTAVSLWDLRRAEVQRALAERRFADARQVVNLMIHDIQPRLPQDAERWLRLTVPSPCARS
jgi:hypothetical protein